METDYLQDGSNICCNSSINSDTGASCIKNALSSLKLGEYNETDEVIFDMPEFRKQFFKEMLQLRSHRNMTDVHLEVGREVIPAHKVVLASASPYFKAMFTSGLQETESSRVRLHGVCPLSMGYLVGFMYSGRVHITEKIVCPLLTAASMLQISQVVTACCQFLSAQMEAANVIGIASFAQQNGCSELHAAATAFIERNFSEVSKDDEFLELTLSQLLFLIKKDELNVPSEEEVYRAVLRWVEHRPDRRKNKMAFILKSIRCHYLPPRFLSEQLTNCGIVPPEAKKYLAEIFKDLSLHKPIEGVARCPPNTMCLIHLVGGYSNKKSQNALYCYHVEKDTWAELSPMQMARSGLGAAFLRGALYAVAGHSIDSAGTLQDTSVVTKYCHSDGSWSTCHSLQQPRHRMGVGVLDGLLYAVGGLDPCSVLSSVERYDTDSWRYVSPLQEARGGLCCAVLNRLLYAIGGCNKETRLNTVECYHPERDVWTKVASLSEARSGAGSAVVCNRIYVVGGHDGRGQLNTVEMYNPETNCWSYVSPMRERRSAVAVAASYNKIYVMGGFDGSELLSSVEIYDVERDEWVAGSPMPWGRSGHALAVPSCILPAPSCAKYRNAGKESSAAAREQCDGRAATAEDILPS